MYVYFVDAVVASQHTRLRQTPTGGCSVFYICTGSCSGDVGSYIVLADWRFEKGEWNLHGVEARKVDGETIKAGVWYTMKDGKVVEA